MRLRFYAAVAALVTVVFVFTSSGLAQPADEPIYFQYDRTIWRWDAETQTPIKVGNRFPEGYRGFTASPNGDYLVYDYVPDEKNYEVGKRRKRVGVDYWLMDLRTGDTKRIAVQPEDRAITRSGVVWKYDGSQVAWTEGMDRKQVVVYDLLSGKTQTIIPRLLVPDVQVLPPLFEWTRSGIIVRQMRLTRNDEALGAFMLYSPEGKLLSKIEAPYPDQQPLESIVVLDGDRDLMMLRYERDTFFFDLLTGERLENVTGTLVRVSASNPSESLQVAPQMIYEDGLQVGQLYAPDGEQVLAYQGVYSFFSPSGHGLIYLWSSKTLEGWSESGGKFTIELPKYPQYLIWGKSAWMLKRGGNLLVKGSYCERGKLSPRLVKYNKGFVLPGDANNLRSAPSVNAAKIGAIPGGETFIVYDGPVCSGGMAWWQVDYDGTVGWTVEGADDEYWLSPGCPDGPCVYEPG